MHLHKRMYYAFLSLLFLFIDMQTGRSQDKPFMEERFAKFQDRFPIESIYLQQDRYQYQAGDTLWWKGYAFDGSGKEISTISTNIYVELFTDKGRLITRQLSPIIQSISTGYLKLPDTLKTARYYIRAYTKY